MQRDEITERDYWLTRTREVGLLLGEHWDRMETLVQRARGAQPDQIIRPQARTAILGAKRKGVRLAILSNELDLFYGAELRARLPLLSEFDAIVDATYTNILKPDPRAYESVCQALQVDARECVFIDDQARNVQGALRAGMVGIELDVRNPALAFEQGLAALGLPVL
jgi:putative hydrolase of the HAD superfamily